MWATVGDVAHWRVVHSGHGDAYTNMAVDEAIMTAVAADLAPPTLRLYGWRPPGVSLGFFQELDGQVALDELHVRGWGLVRRPTGGRAILHDDEVTYSVCVPETWLPDGASVVRSYRELSRGIQRGLELLGVHAELGGEPHAPAAAQSAGARLPAICFTQSSRADMVAAGRKIVGSAQVRRNGVILQHGSVPLSLNINDHLAVLGGRGEAEAAGTLRRAAVGVSEVLGRPVSFSELADSLVAGFAEALGLVLEPGGLTPAEQATAEELRVAKYATEQWNCHRPARGMLPVHGR